MDRTPEQIKADFDKMVSFAQKVVDAYNDEMFPGNKTTVLVNEGKVYWKIVTETNGRSNGVYGFVRKADGAILKAASWAAPHKLVRGYVHDYKNTVLTAYGIEYARGGGGYAPSVYPERD